MKLRFLSLNQIRNVYFPVVTKIFWLLNSVTLALQVTNLIDTKIDSKLTK